MDVFSAAENTFSAACLNRPRRTVEIPTNAPVQTRHDEVESSTGTFVFPPSSAWRDRFIVWRAVGTLLTLEERSVRHTVVENCFAFNFSRAPVVPGTSITLINGVLSVVVVTQSSVHRFSCRLAVDPTENDGDTVEATLGQLLDVVASSVLVRVNGETHEAHQLAARGTPVRAAVAVRPEETRVAVGMGDGQMVIVTLSNSYGGKTEECPVSEAGFMKLFGNKQISGVLDVCAEKTFAKRSVRTEANCTPFYTVNSDGTVRIVNGDTCSTALSVPIADFVDLTGDVCSASIRWDSCGAFGLIVLAVTTQTAVHFILLRDMERQLLKVGETMMPKISRVVDYGVHEMPADMARLYYVANNVQDGVVNEDEREREGEKEETPRATDSYTLNYTNILLPSPDKERGGLGRAALSECNSWFRVRGVAENNEEREELQHRLRSESTAGGYTVGSGRQSKIASASALNMRKEVFNVDKHQFDVLLRAVKITTDSPSSFTVDHGDWRGLLGAVDVYLRSSEFDRKFANADWAATTVVGSKDMRGEGEMRFYRAVAASCTAIERSTARALGLWTVRMEGSHFVGVVQESRLTVVVQSSGELAEQLNQREKNGLMRALEMGKEMDTMEEMDALSPKERNRKKRKTGGSTSSSLFDEEDEEAVQGAVAVFMSSRRRAMEGEERGGERGEGRGGGDRGDREGRRTRRMEEDEMEDSESDSNRSLSPSSSTSGLLSDASASPYGGSFTAGLITCLLRSRVLDDYKIASRLLRLMDQRKIKLEEYRLELWEMMNTLAVLASQLDLYVEREFGGTDSLASWLFSPQALPLLRIEGGYEIDIDLDKPDDERPPINVFISRSVVSVLSSILPTGRTQTMAKLLALRGKWETLKEMYSLWDAGRRHAPAELKYVRAYYTAIAESGGGAPRKALELFKEAAQGMRMGDKSLRRALLPMGVVAARAWREEEDVGIGQFYVSAIKALNEHGHQQEVIEMSREAMGSLPEGSHLSSINATLFKRQVDGSQWCEALDTIDSTRDVSLRRHFLHELLSRMLTAGEWQMIVRADFKGNTNMVESIIVNHARSIDVSSVCPHPYELVGAFHVARNNYAQSAQMQYELAITLRNSPMSAEILRRCKQALTMVLSLLDLLPERRRFIAFPHIVQFARGERRTMLAVKYEELRQEWIMLRGRCELLAAVNSSIPPDEPPALVAALTQAKMYGVALEVCRVIDLDPSGVIEHATTAAITIDVCGEEQMPAWVAANRRLAHKKEKRNEHWSIVRAAVKECRQRWAKDERCLRAATRAFLAHGVPVPYWLQEKSVKSDAGAYCRLLLDYGGRANLETAMGVLTREYKREGDAIKSAQARTCLPHFVTEAVMAAAKREGGEMKEMLTKLEMVVKAHQQRATNFTLTSR